MVPKAERERLQLLLKETLTLLCKNGLPYKSHFRLEALVGVTLDKKDILLVSVNENINGSNTTSPASNVKKQTARRGHGRLYSKQGTQRSIIKGQFFKRPRLVGLDDNETQSQGVGNVGNAGHESGLEGQQLPTQSAADSGQVKNETGGVDDEDESSMNDSDMGSLPDDSSSDSESDDDDADPAAIVLQQMKSDISSKLPVNVDAKELQIRAMETGLLQEYQQAAFGKAKSPSRKQNQTKVGKPKKPDPKLNPMGADESARIWAKAMANAREQKEPSTSKKKSPKKRRSGDSKTTDDGQSGDEAGEKKNEIPPMCHICGKTMSTEKNLTKHVRRHLGMFSVFCDECGKGFFDRTDLDAHAAKHANQKLYQCHVCGRSYSHKRGLLKHIRKDHKGTLVNENVIPNMPPQAPDNSHAHAMGAMSTTPAAPPHDHNPGLVQADPSSLPPPTYSPQPPPQQQQQQQQQQVQMMQMTDADSQMSQSHPVPAMSPQVGSPHTQIGSPMPHSQSLPQLSPQMAHTSSHHGVLPHPAHLSHLRPDLPFPPGLHPMTEASYYFQSTYPSQSVFPGGPTH